MQLITDFRKTFSRLSYPQKFMLITLLFVLPLLAFLPLIARQIEYVNNYGTLELNGTEYLRPLQSMLHDVYEHDIAMRNYFAGRKPRSTADDLASKIDGTVKELEDVNNRFGASLSTEQKPVASEMRTLINKWHDLEDASASVDYDISTSRTQHADLVTAINGLIEEVSQTSFLVLDPEIDTYYMMNTVVSVLPENEAILAEIQTLGEGITARHSMDDQERTHLIVLMTLLERNLAHLDANDKQQSAAMRGNVAGVLDGQRTSNSKVLELLNREFINSSDILTSPETFGQAVSTARQSNSALYLAASDSLRYGIEVRRARELNGMALGLSVTIAGILIGFLTGRGVMRAISRPLDQLSQTARRIAAGDLTARATVESEDEVGKVTEAFNHSLDTLVTLVGTMVDGSAKLSSGATELSAATNQMAAGAESQTQQVIRTSSAMEEISASIKEVARNAHSTASATEAAVTRARQGSAKVNMTLAALNDTNRSLQQLRQRSAEIDQVVKLIADIAATTNILALNAAIEAAGAGAAGARFDVVAEEIRKLAGRTAESTARISATVAEVQFETQATAQRMAETSKQAEAIGQSLNDIVEGITSVNDMIALISSSTSEQARAAEQVAEALQVITHVSQQTAQATHETATTIDDLSGLAQDMSALGQSFKF